MSNEVNEWTIYSQKFKLKTKLYGVGIAALTALTGMVYWKWKQQRHPNYFSDFSTKVKSNAYLHCYSWIRYYAPLLFNNIAIISILALYNSKHSTDSNAASTEAKRYTFFAPTPSSYQHQPKTTHYNTFWIHFSYNSWQFFFNDIVLLASSLNVLFCICTDQIFNSDPIHPLMLFEKYVEYKFIDEYKRSVNGTINEFVDNNLNNTWLLNIIWEYITYDTKKSHMIIDVKFTNPNLKHQSFICRKYKSNLASQFKMYQQDMKFAYQINDKKCIEIKPNFEYFWKIKSFGFDINVFSRDYLDTFKLRDFQQITQFMLWCFVNYAPLYVLGNWLNINNKRSLWKYMCLVIGRESVFYAVLIRITSIKWFCGGFFIIPHLIYQNMQQRQVIAGRKRRKKTIKKIEKTSILKEPEPRIEWFWDMDQLK